MQGGGGCSWVEIFSVKGHVAGSAAVIQPMSSSPVFSFLHPSLQGSHLQGRLAAECGAVPGVALKNPTESSESKHYGSHTLTLT